MRPAHLLVAGIVLVALATIIGSYGMLRVLASPRANDPFLLGGLALGVAGWIVVSVAHRWRRDVVDLDALRRRLDRGSTRASGGPTIVNDPASTEMATLRSRGSRR